MIRFQCTCGRRLKVDDAYAGRPVQCPDCGANLQAPAAPEEPLSGPEALVAAVRASKAPPPNDIPVAEVVDEPAAASADRRLDPQRAQALQGLDSLARAAGPAPAAKARKRVGPPSKTKPGRIPPAARGRGGLPNGRKPAAVGHKNAAVIGVVAAVGLLVILALVAAFIGGGGDSSTPKPIPMPPSVRDPAAEADRPPRLTGPQPGELFKNKAFEPREDEEPGSGAPTGGSR